MQNNKIKIIYFDFDFWRVDICRLTLSIAKIPYEYIRIPRKDWHKRKNSGEFNFGQLPAMIINEKKVAQTSAMARYCGKISNLYPEDNFDSLLVDQILDVVNDVTLSISPSIREKNFEKKKEMRTNLNNTILPKWLNYIEKFTSTHKKSKFIITRNFTIADIMMWRFLLWLNCGLLEHIDTNLLKNYENLNKYFNYISAYKKLKQTNEYNEIIEGIKNRKLVM